MVDQDWIDRMNEPVRPDAMPGIVIGMLVCAVSGFVVGACIVGLVWALS